MDITAIIKAILSWPTAAIVALIILRRPITGLVERLIKSKEGKAKIGPIEIELGKLAEQGQDAVDTLRKINYLMAESRLLELEITDGKFGPFFSEEQRKMMKDHIDEFKKLTEKDP